MKDTKSQEWPILGVCQGLEVLALILGDDDIDEVLDKVFIYGQTRPICHHTPLDQTKMWGDFPQELTNKMQIDDVAFHAHDFSISMETFSKNPKMN